MAEEREPATSTEPPAAASVAESEIPADTYCPDCGYDLRTLTGERCPECGFGLEVVRTREPQIPWDWRRDAGRLRAFWQTVWKIDRRPREFSLEMVRPVSYRDAQRFRWLLFLHAFLPVLVAGVLSPRLFEADDRNAFSMVIAPVLILFALAGWLVALPGVFSYAFESRKVPVSKRNRAIALSYYAWAPLAYTPLALLAFLPGWALFMVFGDSNDYLFVAGVALLLIAGGVYVGVVLLTQFKADAFGGYLYQRRAASRLWRLLLVNFVAVVAALLSLLLPLTVLYLWIVWESLR